MTMRVAVAVSGRGSDLESLLHALGPETPARVVLVLSNTPDAGGLERARAHGVAAEVLPDPDDAADWLARLERHRVDLLVLAGCLKLVPAPVVDRYRHLIVNIHPALLPAFGGRGMYGLRVHEAVLRSGARESGATVHLVDEASDRGAILAQGRVPVLPDDDPERLAARVLVVEHRILPAVVLAAAAAGRPVPIPETVESPLRGSFAMPRALISMSDKRGIVAFAQGLAQLGWEIISTGGTAAALGGAGVGGDHGGRGHRLPRTARRTGEDPATVQFIARVLAAPRPAEHLGALREHGIVPMDLIVVNLYPFQMTIARPGATFEDAVENVDIGGPSMLRSAARSPRVRAAGGGPDRLCESAGAAPPGRARRGRCGASFAPPRSSPTRPRKLRGQRPSRLPDRPRGRACPGGSASRCDRFQMLRYGENPGQRAALYVTEEPRGMRDLTQRQGKELSFNNLLDLDAAMGAVACWTTPPACAVIKHTTPCGIAVAGTAVDAFRKARATDPVSAYGSVVAFNTVVDRATAQAMSDLFVEVVVAPSFHDEAIAVFAAKKALRVVELPVGRGPGALDFKRVRGGFLVQDQFQFDPSDQHWTVASERQPIEREWTDLRFAWAAVASVKSNAILLARDEAAIGIGAGQMSRVDSSFLAVHKARLAGHDPAGSVLASDAYFPFADGVDQAAGAGVTALIQPGGSVRDAEVIEAANRHGVAMVMTGHRQFRH